MKVALGLGLVLATGFCAFSAQLPKECKPNSDNEEAIRDSPSAKVYGQTGHWFEKQGNLKCALAAYEAAIQLEPSSAEAHYNLGAAHVRAQQFTAAAAEFRLALQYKPDMALAHSSLGSVVMDLGKSAEAETEFRAALRINPKLDPALVGLGMVRANQGDDQGAEKVLRQALERDANNAKAHLNLGLVLAKQEKFTKAEAEVDQAVKLAPEDAAALAAAGRVKVRLGKTTEGIELVRKAVTLARQSAVAHLDLGMVLAERYDLAGALIEDSEAVRLAPRSALAHLSRGRALLDLERNTEAKPDLELASHLAPQMPEPYYFLALIEKQAGNYSRAIPLQKKHRIVDEAGTLGNDALAAGKAHDWPEAIRQFQKAIEVCGDCAIKADLHKKLGLTECQMGDIEKGEMELRLAQTLKPADPDIERALQRVALARAKVSASDPTRQKAN